MQNINNYTENIINNSLDMIIAVDTERNIIIFNPAAENVFGYTREEVLGKHVGMLYSETPQSFQVHNAINESGKFEGEVVNRKKNGSTFITYLSSSILRDENGKIIGFMGISRDVAERKRIEEELRSLNQSLEQRIAKYRQIHSIAFDSMIIADIEGRIAEINHVTEKVFGYERDELFGLNIT